ncbi:hypothetical protein [Variovorax saccharolyticus]|uniref:hypothetical protein n=1 Tax=Variovorax saccharolyticus TaxID=3053516 RepID=UPI002574C66F|nr:hypothetical protein [Variovorax sp. J31P216]MDM0030486.1 hypothetical protein [Variovorax sp. J31P216]
MKPCTSYLCFASIAMGALGSVSAASVDEWNTAAGAGEICKTIPFSSLRDKCLNELRDTQACKGGSGPFSCSGYDPSVSIASRKKSMELRSNTTDSAEKDKYSKEVEVAESNLKEYRDKIEKAHYVAKQCRVARESQDKTWEDAISPGRSDASDQAKAVYAQPLLVRWEANLSDHRRQALPDAVKAEETCKKFNDMIP